MLDEISSREKEVLYHIAYGNTANEIAVKLLISVHTVITHRRNLIDKLDARNTAGLVRRGFELGLLQNTLSEV